MCDTPGLVKAKSLVREIQEFLAECPQATLVEEGAVLFDLSRARLSITMEREKCLLHVWSEERNIVRRITDCERKNGVLRLKAQKFGVAKPQTIEIMADRDLRSASTKRTQRSTYQRLLARVLARTSPGATVEKISTAADLERSFGPVHTRALVKKGNSAWAVVGVNAAEAQPAIDAALTTGILWLHDCRERHGHRVLVEGLRIFLPAGTSNTVRARVANLNHAAAKYEVCELEERDEIVTPFETHDAGNLFTRLTRCPDRATVHANFAPEIARITKVVPESEINVHSPTEIAFRFRGLEFARARRGLSKDSFAQTVEVTFGSGPFETPLTAKAEAMFKGLMERVQVSRSATGDRRDPLYRMQPERWLESVLRRSVGAIDSDLDDDTVYAQVPAFAASDRAMIDLLTVTRAGRLAVIELKADEDIHLPLQGLDYWSRVNWHHQRGEFQQFGYFSGKPLSPESPLLYLVAPALRIHPATDTLLRYVSSKIEVTVVGVNEKWREGVEVVFRKRRPHSLGAARYLLHERANSPRVTS